MPPRSCPRRGSSPRRCLPTAPPSACASPSTARAGASRTSSASACWARTVARWGPALAGACLHAARLGMGIRMGSQEPGRLQWYTSVRVGHAPVHVHVHVRCRFRTRQTCSRVAVLPLSASKVMLDHTFCQPPAVKWAQVACTCNKPTLEQYVACRLLPSMLEAMLSSCLSSKLFKPCSRLLAF